MKYNAAKRGLEITVGSIIILLSGAIIICSFLPIIPGGFLIFFSYDATSQPPEPSDTGTLLWICWLIIALAIFIIAIFMLTEPGKDKDGNPKAKTGVPITLTILVPIFLLLPTVLIVLNKFAPALESYLIVGAVLAVILSLLIICICLPLDVTEKQKKKEKQAEKVKISSETATDEQKEFLKKVDALKGFKDTRIITEEQYNEALDKLIQEYKKTL